MRAPMLQKMAVGLMGLVLIWLIYFVVFHIGRLFWIRFGNLAILPQLYGLQTDIDISAGSRNIIFLLWTVTYTFGVCATYFSLKALNEVRLSRLFTYGITHSLIGLGGCLAAAMIIGITAFNIERFIMFAYRPDLTYGFAIWSPISELPLILCGASFVFIGLVATEAVRLQTENEEIV